MDERKEGRTFVAFELHARGGNGESKRRKPQANASKGTPVTRRETERKERYAREGWKRAIGVGRRRGIKGTLVVGINI